MFDWKKKIDDQEEAQRQERERAEVEKRNREHEAQIRNWQKFQKRFVCHVCGQPSQKVRVVSRMVSPGASNDGLGGYSPTYEVTNDFNTPDDMTKCQRCNRWTHHAHIHKGICQGCAEKI